MSKPNESYIRVSYGEDGNPQIETNCVGLEASKLCVALLAALAAGSDDPAGSHFDRNQCRRSAGSRGT